MLTRKRQKTKRIKKTKKTKKVKRHLRRQRGAGPLFFINYATIGKIIGQDLTQQPKVYHNKPSVLLSGTDKDKTYTVIMLDPDAPNGKSKGGKKTWTHWVARLNSAGTVLSEPYPYQPPSPPAGSGKHRYIFNVYEDLPEATPNNLLSGDDYYMQVLKQLLQGHKPIAEAVQFTVKG